MWFIDRYSRFFFYSNGVQNLNQRETQIDRGISAE
jgi:hypothetical protein